MNPASSGQRTTALVTGASSGIGRDLAALFAADGHDVVLVARNQTALEELARNSESRWGIRAHVLVADLADPAAPQRIVDELERRSIAPDYLVNNAGIGTYGRFAEVDAAAHMGAIQVNVMALTNLTRLLLPGMIERRRGRILNVGSTAGFVPGPYLSVYYATKAYVVSQSLALARELRHSGVSVTVLCPGPTITEFQKRSGMEGAVMLRWAMRSEDVARAGYKGMMRGKTIVIPGMLNKIIAFSTRFAPRGLLARIAMKLNSKK